MKIKQLESLRTQHKNNLELKGVEKPSFDKSISLAIISGQPLKLRSSAEILDAARKSIADCACRYGGNRTLTFAQVFSFKSEELDQYTNAKKARDKMVTAYTKQSDRIMRRAEMDDSFDATEASEQLAQAAHDAGLLD